LVAGLTIGNEFSSKNPSGFEIAAVSELGSPVIPSTITVILAFLPMGFVTGMMGPYMGHDITQRRRGHRER